MPSGWTLRPVTADDAELLLRIYASTREEELALTRWNPAARDAFVRMQAKAQSRHYQQHWPDAEHSVILRVEPGREPQPVGRLWMYRRPGRIDVLDIAVLTAWRGQGLGGQVLGQLLAEAEAGGSEVSIYVETNSPARRLYDRLGFHPVGEPEGIHQYMVRPTIEQQNLEHCHEQA